MSNSFCVVKKEASELPEVKRIRGGCIKAGWCWRRSEEGRAAARYVSHKWAASRPGSLGDGPLGIHGRMDDWCPAGLPCASKTSMACFNAAGMPPPPPPSHFISCNPQPPLSHAPGWRDNNDLLKSACWPWLSARPKPQIVFPRSILYTSRLNGLKIMCTISLYLVIFSI